MSRRTWLLIRRTLPAVLLAIAIEAQIWTGPVSAFSQANGVTWSIDHTAKTITADVRLTLTPACTANQMAAAAVNPVTRSRCTVTQEQADAIKADVERVWNKGNRYYCYDIVVHLDIKIDNALGGPDPANRVKVQITQTPTHRSFVSSAGHQGATWNGSTPNDQNLAVNDGGGSSTWTYPSGAWGDTLYAHEAGHILGLDDAYEDYKGEDGQTYSRPKAGAPVDLMSQGGTATIDKTTLRRMVERAGYKKTDLKCNYKIDQHAFGGGINGTKCDPLGGKWIAQGTYSKAGAKGRQEWIITLDANTKTGTYTYTDHQVATFVAGVTVTTDGDASGVASLIVDDELNARIHLQEKQHTYVATVPGGGKGLDQNAPLAAIDLIWEPIGRCPN